MLSNEDPDYRKALEYSLRFCGYRERSKKEVLDKLISKNYEKELIQKVINENPDKVSEYKSGKVKLFGFFVGQAMKISGGKANPQLVNEIFKKKLH